jgi:hypothetical protein
MVWRPQKARWKVPRDSSPIPGLARPLRAYPCKRHQASTLLPGIEQHRKLGEGDASGAGLLVGFAHSPKDVAEWGCPTGGVRACRARLGAICGSIRVMLGNAMQKDSFELIGRRIRSILTRLLHSLTLRAPRFSRGCASLNFTPSSFPSRGVRCKWQSVGPHLTFWLPSPTEGQRCALASLKIAVRTIWAHGR